MRTIISGSRTITSYAVVKNAIETSGFIITELIHGAQRGKYIDINGIKTWHPTVDLLGEQWAKEKDVPFTRYPADWHTHPRSAGVIRNAQMAKVGQQLIAIWDGESNGTKNMINHVYIEQKPIYIWIYNPRYSLDYGFHLEHDGNFEIQLQITQLTTEMQQGIEFHDSSC